MSTLSSEGLLTVVMRTEIVLGTQEVTLKV